MSLGEVCPGVTEMREKDRKQREKIDQERIEEIVIMGDQVRGGTTIKEENMQKVIGIEKAGTPHLTEIEITGEGAVERSVLNQEVQKITMVKEYMRK